MSDDAVPPLSARVDRLFGTFHTRTEPEQSVTEVARSVSTIMGVPVSAAKLAELRDENLGPDGDGTDHGLLAALAQHFRVPADYLLGDNATVTAIDRELRLLSAARDAGVRHMDFRGDEVDIGELTEQLSHLAGKHMISEEHGD
ncbi:hypothetical protein [Nocardia carnea]|uniref:hypothetical protein n=1 Tax=Nocardia carnea TaxID=37328 RepID=UPI002457D41B|nr:hypothetical protein [Nocardia carnea]